VIYESYLLCCTSDHSCSHLRNVVCLSWLQLEENICSIALSCDWFKQMDDWLIEHSIFQSAPVTLGVPQRRGPGRTKQNTQAEVTAEGSDADSFTWWRGGKLSKVILLKAVLSQPATKKAAWQGITITCLFMFYVRLNLVLVF